MIVVDASAYLELLIGSRNSDMVREILLAERSAVPHLFDAEVLHQVVLLRKSGVWGRDEATRAIEQLESAPMDRIDHRPRLMAAAELSSALSGYDALYAVLAIEFDATLVTADLRLARTARSQLDIRVRELT